MTIPNHHFPQVTREAPLSVVTPLIPLNFVYPGLSLSQFFSIIRAYWKLTLFILLVVLSVTVLVMTLWPRTYTAMATLMVNYEVNDPLNGKELPVGQVSNYIATQVELMQTPEVILGVVDRLKLVNNKEYARGYKGNNGTLREWVGQKVTKNLAIYPGQQGSQLIYVTYSANHPKEAAQVANAVVAIYKEQDHMRSTGPPGERAKHYAEQLKELKSKVDEAQQQVTAFYQRNGLINEGDKTNVDMVLLATLEGRLLEAQNARRTAEAQAAGDRAVNSQVLSSSLVQALKTQLATQKAKLAQLNSIYTRRHPDIVEIQAQIKITQQALNSTLKSYSDNTAAGLAGAQQLEQTLQQAVADQRAKILQKGQLQDEATKYQLALDSAQSVYKRALEGYDQIRFASSGRNTNVSLVSPATPPVKPSKPRLLRALLLGVMAAGVLGFGIPLLFELFNRRVRCRDDIERNHGIPVLIEFGALPMRSAI